MLPPYVLVPLPEDPRKRDDGDIKLFLMSFAAFFIATYSFVF